MAGKMKLGQAALAFGVGVGAYVAGAKIAQSSTTVQKYWYAQPAIIGAVGLVAMKKHPAIGFSALGAAGALGYFQYSVNKGTVASAPAQTTAQTTVAQQPAAATPAQATPAAIPASTTQPGTTDNTGAVAAQAAAQALQSLIQQGSQSTPADQGGGDTTTTAGYGAGALLGASRIRRGGHGYGSGALVGYGANSQFRLRPDVGGYGAPGPGDAGLLLRRRVAGAAGLES